MSYVEDMASLYSPVGTAEIRGEGGAGVQSYAKCKVGLGTIRVRTALDD